MKKTTLLITVLCVLACSQGCNQNSNTTADNQSPKKLRLALVTNTTNDFWVTVRHGCNSAAHNLGNVDVDFRFFTGSTVEAQEALVSDLVASGVDGIAISPIDAEKQTDFLNGIAAKTLLICVDSDAPNSQRVCFIGSDNVAAGKRAADLLKAALPQGGKIVFCVGYPDAQNAKDRIQAIQNELAGSNIQIIDTLADGTQTDVAQKNAQDALAKYPDLAGLVGLYSYNGPAILSAVRAAGKAGKVKIVCFDDDSATLDGIAAGDIYGTVVQISTRIGYEAINRMDKYLGGDKSQLSEGKILFSCISVDKAKVEAIQTYRQNLLQP
jgi:ribose transport system substrate-binding protein